MSQRMRTAVTGQKPGSEARATRRQKAIAWFIVLLFLFSILASLGTLFTE